MPNKKEFISLVVFTLACVLTIFFMHLFTQFKPVEVQPLLKKSLSEYTEEVASEENPQAADEINSFKEYRNILGFANFHAIPIGMMLLILMLLCGLMLFNMLSGSPDYTLIILAAAHAIFAINSLSRAEGGFFLPPVANAVLGSRYTIYVVPVLLIIYLALNIRKRVMVYFTYLSITVAVVFLLRYLINVAKGIFVPDIVEIAPKELLFRGIALRTSAVAIFIAFFAAYIYHIDKYAQILIKNQVLKIQNRLITKNYETMVQNIHQTQAMRHEWKNNIIAMGLMYKQGKTEELGQYIENLSDNLSDVAIPHFTENFTINAIVSNAAAKARENNINFRANIYVPKKLNISDDDLCSLLINMLDNSI